MRRKGSYEYKYDAYTDLKGRPQIFPRTSAPAPIILALHTIMYYSHILGEPRPQREPNELTGPVYKALHATRADLAPSLAPEWSFTLVDTTTNMENYDNHQQCWTILSHRNGGPTHINEIDILITTEKETSNFRFSAARYDYSKVFVFKDLRSPGGTGQEFGRFQCFYKDNQLITISSPDGGIFSPNNNGVFLNLVASTISSVFNLNRQIHRMKLIFKSGGNSHKVSSWLLSPVLSKKSHDYLIADLSSGFKRTSGYT